MKRRNRVTHRTILAGLLFILSIGFHNNVKAQTGEALFKSMCANCHKPDVKYTGPALKGWASREPSPGWIYQWVANPAGTNDPYATALKKEYAPTIMTGFPQLTKDEIDAIMKYVDDWAPPVAAVAAGGGAGGADGTSDNSLIYGILALALAIVGFILLQVNSNLRKLSDDKEGIRRGEPIPFYRNKTYLMAGTLVLFAMGGYFMVNAAIGLGRMINYQPEQPIYYSHTVHAGTNQISCLYCHSGAQDSKFSNIPSVNVCMNCHMAVVEYKGEDKLVREDGTPVDGTAEIQKLYKYAGWNPKKGKYNPDNNGDGKPDGSSEIPWVKIHNLPDHVYFNHSQHVKVGKVQCQTCHGNIQEMGEVKQFAELSMGWCINCHRESKVDIYNPADSTGNKFYSIYEKFYEQMSDSVIDKGGHKVPNPHKLDSITVEGIGGIECQKCHY